MEDKVKVGIVLCAIHCAQCAGGKCFRALRNREGAFSIYKDREVELVGYADCGGCPGGYISRNRLEEMIKNGVQVIHLASGWVCGYPPCPYLSYLRDIMTKIHGLEVVVGTHPIPQTFLDRHTMLGSWDSPEWQEFIKPTLADEKTRLAYE